ncbi:hypothetical protein VTN02DRAFT_5105 [Thermoascus thermophilus]
MRFKTRASGCQGPYCPAPETLSSSCQTLHLLENGEGKGGLGRRAAAARIRSDRRLEHDLYGSGRRRRRYGIGRIRQCLWNRTDRRALPGWLFMCPPESTTDQVAMPDPKAVDQLTLLNAILQETSVCGLLSQWPTPSERPCRPARWLDTPTSLLVCVFRLNGFTIHRNWRPSPTWSAGSTARHSMEMKHRFRA